MKLKFLPFSLVPLKRLSKSAHIFIGISRKLRKTFPYLELDLKQAKIDIISEEYLSLCISASSSFFIFIGIIVFAILSAINMNADEKFSPILITMLITSVLTFFVFLQQINYPKLLKNRRVKDLETNLLHALRNILVQVSAGVPLFNVLVSIGNGDYGEISDEFKIAVKEISAGKPQVDALKEMTVNNPSIYFRRAIWQLANGMRAGSDVSQVLEEIIKSISEEQMVQINSYGAQLNPIAMFYMLLTVIVPSLSITFLIILSSFLSFSEVFTKIMFWTLFSIVVFMQLMFLGLIKAKRPTLMGE